MPDTLTPHQLVTPHQLACRMLRRAGLLDLRDLPRPRRGESLIDWLCRSGVALTPSRPR